MSVPQEKMNAMDTDIGRIADALERIADALSPRRATAPVGLGSHDRVAWYLEEHGPASSWEIAERVELSRSRVARILNADPRFVRYSGTPEGGRGVIARWALTGRALRGAHQDRREDGDGMCARDVCTCAAERESAVQGLLS